ncbi:response regulator [Caldimonas thermodepolymerans]|uniref:histidine kinase n=1 Tax=Caldimonas thermodepolymerans TaxID=215580 RepID=A0A2S5T9T1_9BURK|nr:ATP-binding protein [Caldimonas thermodepolymerans]PPE71702.1 hybrid sensor histidine kinase/response regulator [Caldimonas thermodepolymerans]QPC30728.1 response regulator [Caldimonas thermodepolymerans]RDI02653.1 signal transduction histidine kinase [Caldimonas thermodepolymerans]
MSSPSLLSGPADATETAGRARELPDHVRNLYAYTASSLLGNLIGSTVVVMLHVGFAPPLMLTLWAAGFALVWAYRAWIAYRFAKVQLDPATDFAAWQRRWNAGILASGAMWGTAALLFYSRGEAIQQIGLIITIFSYCVASVPVLAEHRKLFLTFLGLCFVPTIASIAAERTLYSYELAGVLMLTMAMTALLGRNYRQAMERVIELKVRTEQLAEQLRVEKEVAEAARRDAEVANRAKTQFFAAASHDLRQPLHAVGLFAEALRSKSRDEEVIQLVNSINSSVDALEGLFSELLDITKIDTGAVECRPEHFSLRDIFARQRLHYEPIAFEKGLELKFRGGHHHAYADPVLVDRILRNLISNAIRYTEDGGVLVSCRARGDRLLLQVWDSGVGIREQELGRIFEEFYQVKVDQPLPPHQRKGLGLGLAIVRRLADLMQAELTVRSVPGRGTVFSLWVPKGRPPRIEEATAPRSAPLGLTLDRRHIVVVEDEPAVREGLEVLLKSWGATVYAFDTVEPCRQWAAQASQQGLRPDLVLVDYRLDASSNGIDALKMLRGFFDASLPAIMVTGSTTATLEAEAQKHDFHLLFKPVVPNKLRAMIAFKLNVRSR